MSKSATSRSPLLPLFKSNRKHTNLITPISIEDAKDYRPSVIRHLDLTLKKRSQDLQYTERKLTNAKSLLALCAVYAIVMTIIAVGGAL